ncbi:hypothetical protein [Rhodopseudomonas sp. BR0G17]|nr:hypothetical protein [Rhodopseudomonas sp. BR0G17]
MPDRVELAAFALFAVVLVITLDPIIARATRVFAFFEIINRGMQ